MITIVVHYIVLGGWLIIFSNVCILIFGDITAEVLYGFCWVFFALTNFSQYFTWLAAPTISNFVKTHISATIVPANPVKLILYPAILFSVLGIIICTLSKLQGRW